ncbi:MAG: hypothetical protein DRI61_07250 [Chloroflexi bacterium]|nr:MAG: hypothetical protein DRI61_07250 [Chloroflexota bacterium]HDN79437.1 alpha/beta hydrolase [Chloroflexota bacterium]
MLTKRIQIRENLALNVLDTAWERGYGEGPVIVFIHGAMGQLTNWKYQIEYLKDRWRVVAYDCRNHGGSDKFLELTPESTVEDLKLLLEKLGIEGKVIPVGHSYGGMVAQVFARKNPQVAKLVLVNSAARYTVTWDEKLIHSLPASVWSKLLLTDNALARYFYRKTYFSDATPREIVEEFFADNKEHLESMPPHTVLSFKGFWGFDSTPWLAEIEAPTLIIVGKDDKVCPVSKAEEMHRLIPNSELVVFENCGHISMYEQRDALNKALEEFIEK